MPSNPTGEGWIRLVNAFAEGCAEAYGWPAGREKYDQYRAWVGQRWRSSSKKLRRRKLSR